MWHLRLPNVKAEKTEAWFDRNLIHIFTVCEPKLGANKFHVFSAKINHFWGLYSQVSLNFTHAYIFFASRFRRWAGKPQYATSTLSTLASSSRISTLALQTLEMMTKQQVETNIVTQTWIIVDDTWGAVDSNEKHLNQHKSTLCVGERSSLFRIQEVLGPQKERERERERILFSFVIEYVWYTYIYIYW